MEARHEYRQEHGHNCNHAEGSCVSLVPIFNHLEAEQMVEIMSVVKSISFKRGEIIYRAGEESDSLFIVNKGKIRIYRLSESGKEQLVRILNPGDFMGEYALFSKSTHESYAEAMVHTEVCMVNYSDLQELLVKYPTISLKVLSEFSSRLEQSEKQTTRFATEKVDTRIALFLAECLGNKDQSVITLPMNKKDLASYLGTTPETISRKLAELAELEEEGLIKQKSNKEIEVLDLNELLLV
ncbi:cyclic nucleotide-binding domain-containing protein [Ornithinibacillus sp. L9]|uniref:Cyclic nucleotide-binding domain-containing protein n=1 Tax=Ornithinibacillus caprae TaxID=2678566 RepID=A0A6N8FGJ1_9BACI|nr:Crp/Fnr family transcriptional regulator [Ornithinibacillus caprae]MUK87796.1 cyclic nucleotide-binding domain-containing protein [Ornithinibacillus caprae]